MPRGGPVKIRFGQESFEDGDCAMPHGGPAKPHGPAPKVQNERNQRPTGQNERKARPKRPKCDESKVPRPKRPKRKESKAQKAKMKGINCSREGAGVGKNLWV